MIVIKFALLTFLLIFHLNISHADTSKKQVDLSSMDWNEISNNDGVTVFRSKNYKHSSGLVPIRFKVILKHNILKVLSVLVDNTRKREWVPKLVEARTVEKKSIRNYTVYYRYDSPWPFKDRAFLIQNLGKFNTQTQKVFVKIQSVELPTVPKNDKYVRGQTYSGYSRIESINKNETSLEMAFINDFGGVIPKFIINIVQAKWPYQFMKNLKRQLAKKDIQILSDFKNVPQ